MDQIKKVDRVTVKPETGMILRNVSMVIAVGLLVLTAYGNAHVMFWVSLTATFLLFVWFAAERRVWLASVAGVTFLVSALVAAKSLF